MPEVPAVSRSSELSAAVAAPFAPAGPLARALPGFEARPAQLDMADAVADGVRRRRHPARRSRHRHRQDAGVSRPGDPQPAARPRLHRHQEPPGADLLQGSPGPARVARRAVHRRLHEGPRELPLPAPLRDAARRRRVGHGRRHGPRRREPVPRADHRSVGRARPRPATAPRSRTCPKTCRSGPTSPRPPRTASAPTARAIRTASSSACGSARPSPTS